MPKSRRKVYGYIARQELARAVRANTDARKALQRMIDENVSTSSQLFILLAAKIAMGLGETLEAIMEVEKILQDAENGDN